MSKAIKVKEVITDEAAITQTIDRLGNVIKTGDLVMIPANIKNIEEDGVVICSPLHPSEKEENQEFSVINTQIDQYPVK